MRVYLSLHRFLKAEVLMNKQEYLGIGQGERENHDWWFSSSSYGFISLFDK